MRLLIILVAVLAARLAPVSVKSGAPDRSVPDNTCSPAQTDWPAARGRRSYKMLRWKAAAWVMALGLAFGFAAFIAWAAQNPHIHKQAVGGSSVRQEMSYDFAPSEFRQHVANRRDAGVAPPDPYMVELESVNRERSVALEQDQALISRYYQEILSRDRDIVTLQEAAKAEQMSLSTIATQLGLPHDQLALPTPPSPAGVGALLPADQAALANDRPMPAQPGSVVHSLAELDALVQHYLALPCPLSAGDPRCAQAIGHAKTELIRGHGLDITEPDAVPTLAMVVAQRFGPTSEEFEPLAAVNGKLVHFHDGLDLAASYGEPVMAAASGVVVFAGTIPSGALTVEIAHAGGLHTLYLHEEELLVYVGQPVQKGQVIGLVGATGVATGPHVHFQIHDANGRSLDPMLLLT